MNKLLTTLFALSVACATGLAQAQTAPAAAREAAAATGGPKSLEAKIEMCVGCHGIPATRRASPKCTGCR